EPAHFYPSFLPDGKHFLYLVADGGGIYLDQIGNSSPRRLLDADGGAVYFSGYLLFPRQGTLLAQAFDPSRLELHGDAFPIAQKLGPSGALETFRISVSDDQKILYRKSLAGTRQFVWFDRQGKELEKVSTPVDSQAGSLSAARGQVAFSTTDVLL